MARCPECNSATLDDGGRCETCGGELALEDDAADLLARLHIDRAFFTQLLDEHATLGHDCPSCSYRMKRVPVRGQRVDFCTGCGAMWLDAGERDRMMEPPKPKPVPRREWPKRRTRVPSNGRTAIIGAGVVALSSAWSVFVAEPLILGFAVLGALALYVELSSRVKVDGYAGIVDVRGTRIPIDEVVSVRLLPAGLGARVVMVTRNEEVHIGTYEMPRQAREAQAVLSAAAGLDPSGRKL